ncbi:hypothetical protein KC332_g3615 [Hortaea werneckii]|nr:hypothetical protein KC350_g2386 [Hortaea werneckii]KAI6850222.1 hypothetical protein KC358_g809 [Hortaea werneckii]KAI6940788.1 hypothetical protein KC348_g4911 [Hortaea werneckii]KAI6941129.1 hypothetical protein KC341_g3117 [Hortaea werneckii]KAI6978759.1 hypothetical protein KC321_g2721 [Hortaea werneckii]
MLHAAEDAELDLGLTVDLGMEALVNELATKWDPAMAQDSELDIFSTDWLMGFTGVTRCLNTATLLSEELNQAKAELADHRGRREYAIRKRCQSQLKAHEIMQASERIRALASEHLVELKAIDDLLHKTSRRFKSAEREYQQARRSLLEVSEETLAAADQALVAAGFLDFPEDDTTHGKQNDSEQPSAQDDTTEARNHDHARQDKDSNRPVSPPVFHPPSQRDLIRQECKRELDNAKRDMSEASRDFDRLRDGYDLRLKDFYNDRDNGRVTGTKTDFDAAYFLARNDTNQRLTLAEDRLYRAKRIAQDAGVLPALEQSSNFADRSDDGCQEEESLAMARLDRDRVERWRIDEAQKKIEPVGVAWESRLVDHSPDQGSIAAISSRSQDRYDTSRRSKLIARWKKQQGEEFAVEDQRRLRWKTVHRA